MKCTRRSPPAAIQGQQPYHARPRSAESTQQNQRSRISAGSSNAGSSTPDPKHNARNPSRSAESTGARLKETPDPAQQNQRGIARPTPPLSLSACIGPARIGISRPTSPLSLGLHRPGPHWHLQAHIPSPTAPVPFQHRGGPEDREIKSFLADIDQSTQIGNKP